MQVYSTRRDVGARYCELLGRICIEFSIFEMYVDRTIYALQGDTRKIGRVKLMRKQITNRLRIMESAAEKRFGIASSEAEAYRTLVSLLGKVCESRNAVVHGLWSRGTNKGDKRNWYVLSYFADPKGRAVPVSIDELVGVRESLAHVVEILEGVIKETLGLSLKTLP